MRKRCAKSLLSETVLAKPGGFNGEGKPLLLGLQRPRLDFALSPDRRLLSLNVKGGGNHNPALILARSISFFLETSTSSPPLMAFHIGQDAQVSRINFHVARSRIVTLSIYWKDQRFITVICTPIPGKRPTVEAYR